MAAVAVHNGMTLWRWCAVTVLWVCSRSRLGLARGVLLLVGRMILWVTLLWIMRWILVLRRILCGLSTSGRPIHGARRGHGIAGVVLCMLRMICTRRRVAHRCALMITVSVVIGLTCICVGMIASLSLFLTLKETVAGIVNVRELELGLLQQLFADVDTFKARVLPGCLEIVFGIFKGVI